MSRLTPYVTAHAEPKGEVGRAFGLAVAGFQGTIIEIEAIAFPAVKERRGTVRFNDAAGTMAKDSVFNALAVYRHVTGRDAADFDIHVNIVGGGRVEGPSAGAAIFLAIYSAIEGIPLRQDVAVTGELSIQGHVRGVGGVTEKIYGARQVGIKKVLVPRENSRELPGELWGVQVVSIDKINEAFSHTLNLENAAGNTQVNITAAGKHTGRENGAGKHTGRKNWCARRIQELALKPPKETWPPENEMEKPFMPDKTKLEYVLGT
ncbi:MAG: S16 family serine protease [Syntrophaceticus schinkii]